MSEKPPYAVTPEMVACIERIGEAIGWAEAAGLARDARAQRFNRVRAVRGSLAIEGNTLSEEQVSTLLDGEAVVAPLKDIQEARNAIQAYDRLHLWQPAREADLLEAHRVLMVGLLDGPGTYRRGRVAVMGRGGLRHLAPPAGRVPLLMTNLLAWLECAEEHPLIASSVFHYEFEFIHPFADGNGRVGRLWQTLILSRWKPLFAHIPIESLVHARHRGYYEAIARSSREGESTPFIAFMLDAILEALRTLPGSVDQVTDQVTDQVKSLLAALKSGPQPAIELMARLGLAHRPTFRSNYLRPAISAGLVEMTRPGSPTARDQKYRLTALGERLRAGARA